MAGLFRSRRRRICAGELPRPFLKAIQARKPDARKMAQPARIVETERFNPGHCGRTSSNVSTCSCLRRREADFGVPEHVHHLGRGASW